jgi:hypothetical protein
MHGETVKFVKIIVLSLLFSYMFGLYIAGVSTSGLIFKIPVGASTLYGDYSFTSKEA